MRPLRILILTLRRIVRVAGAPVPHDLKVYHD
jgi:hypothetical protein